MDMRVYLEGCLGRDRDGFVKLCQGLVRIPSENPPGDTRAVMDYAAGYLERRGLDFDIVAPDPTMPNLVASIAGGEEGKHLVLNGHLDTFPAGDPSLWSDSPFSGALRDGKIFGRGVSDMKTGVAASLITFMYLAGMRDQLKGRLTLTLVSDEETFGPSGARYLMEHGPDVLGDCLLNGEPGTPNLVVCGEKGFLWLEMRVAARGGHGAYGEQGAIKETAAIIQELEGLTTAGIQLPPDTLEKIEAAREVFDREHGPGSTDNLLRLTANPGVIEGGTKINMSAAHCRTEVDIRCPVGVPTGAAMASFEEVLRRHPAASYRVVNRSEPSYFDPNHEMVRIVQRNAEQFRWIRPTPGVILGATDARLWRLRGIPAIVYGPVPNNMGAPDEFVTLEDFFGTVWVHVLSAFDYLMGL